MNYLKIMATGNNILLSDKLIPFYRKQFAQSRKTQTFHVKRADYTCASFIYSQH